MRLARFPASRTSSFALLLRLLATLSILLAAAAPLAALEVTVTVENLAPENGGVLTPMWVGVHDGSFDVYDLGAPASASLERIAEDGVPAMLSAEFLGSGAGLVDGVMFGPGAPAVPVIFPGQKASVTLDLDPAAATSRYLSFTSMVIPSNDAFIANDDPLAHPIFDGSGNFLGGDFIVFGKEVRDAGTEVNDESPTNTAFFGQATPDTGADEGGVVMMHGGLLPVGSGGILDSPDFAAADFTKPGYRVARIRVTARRGTAIRFPLSGAQEVPPVTSSLTGFCEARLNPEETRLHIECDHEVDDAVAAHIHSGTPDVNGPILFNLGDATSPIVADWDLTPADVDALLAGRLYVNVHSPAHPGGEVRGQIDGCFDGPVGLCLGDKKRFQITARWTDFDGNSGSAVAVPLTSDSGTFYFFSADNTELLVKVIDGCNFNDRYWVFLSGLTNVEVELTVEDTWTGTTAEYDNALGQTFEPRLDIEAFATCP
jgi:CHRD domain